MFLPPWFQSYLNYCLRTVNLTGRKKKGKCRSHHPLTLVLFLVWLSFSKPGFDHPASDTLSGCCFRGCSNHSANCPELSSCPLAGSPLSLMLLLFDYCCLLAPWLWRTAASLILPLYKDCPVLSHYVFISRIYLLTPLLLPQSFPHQDLFHPHLITAS